MNGDRHTTGPASSNGKTPDRGSGDRGSTPRVGTIRDYVSDRVFDGKRPIPPSQLEKLRKSHERR